MSSRRLSVESVRDRATITVDELAQLLGCSRGTAYESVRRGEIPALHLGRRVLIPVPRLLALLGDELDD